MLVAARGCGMTRFLRHLEELKGFGHRATEVLVTREDPVSGRSIHESLCRALGYPRVPVDPEDAVDRAFAAGAMQGVQTIWLMDRCHDGVARVARELSDAHSNVSVVIGVTPEQLVKQMSLFGRTGLMQIDLAPLSLEDTIDYVGYAMEHAGGTRKLFPDGTIVRMYEMTFGVLGRLSVLAESSLALAASYQMDEIGPEIVEAIGQQVSRAA